MKDTRKKNRTVVTAVFAVVSFIAALLLLHFYSPPMVFDSGYRTVMGTLADVKVVAEDSAAAQKSITAAFEQFEEVERLMSYHDPNSQINQINRDAFRYPVKVDESIFKVLEEAVKFSRLSDSAFDITVAPLIDLWNAAEEADKLPTQEEIDAAKAKVGSDNLILDPSHKTVRFAVEGMKLDLGGIAKGYAIDKAIEAIQEAGAFGAMVDVGGDIRVFGTPPRNKKFWSIGMQDPKDTSDVVGPGVYLLVLNVNDAAVTTSGDYRRYVSIQGQQFSHIIDTATGESAIDLTSVTIITHTAMKADALATAVTVLGIEKGLKLVESLADAEAILISSAPDYKIIKSSGANGYIK